MILMDIPEPRTCEDCPCAYWIRGGKYEGMLMCNAMEFKTRSEREFREDISHYFLVAPEAHRPEGCPIKLADVKTGG